MNPRRWEDEEELVDIVADLRRKVQEWEYTLPIRLQPAAKVDSCCVRSDAAKFRMALVNHFADRKLVLGESFCDVFEDPFI